MTRKGTNPDASIKAIEAMKENIILIAGGYDKDASFKEFVDAFDGRVKMLLLMGKTATKIKDAAEESGIYRFDNTQGYGSLCKRSLQDRSAGRCRSSFAGLCQLGYVHQLRAEGQSF